MIGVDTNILVRIFASDHQDQRTAAVRLIDELPEFETAFVNTIVIAELLWTLGRRYSFEGQQLAAVIRTLTEHPRIQVAHTDAVRDAAHRTREDGGQIVDNFIAVLNAESGCTTTYTFDQEAAAISGFTLLE